MVDFRDLKNSKTPSDSPTETSSTEVSLHDPEAGSGSGAGESRPADGAARDLYEQAVRYVSRTFETVRRKEAVGVQPGLRIVQQMAERKPAAEALFVMAIRADNRHPFIVAHCVNTAILAVKMGAGLGFGLDRQIQIGTAALLHDIGTALIAENIVNKAGRLTDQEFALFRERPQRSYRILNSTDDSSPYLADIAQQVYERIDGSGYPLGLKGDEIHEDAQIIGLVDIYEALVHDRPQREHWLHFAAVKEIIKTAKNAFDRKHLKCLLNVFSIFPISSYVRLNSDAIGKVIETYPDQPMRPKLQIMFDSQMRKVLTERIVKLSENPLLYIVDSVSKQELKEMGASAHTR